MGQGQSRRTEVAAFSDPYAGEPLRGDATAPDVFSDPYAGEPLRVATKSANLPEMRPVPSHEPAQPTWSDRLGLNQPSDSMLGGFLRGAGAGAVDLVQGAAANVTGQMNAKVQAENALRREMGSKTEAPPITEVQKPDTFSGTVGSALPAVGEMMLGGAPAARQIAGAIPSAVRAGEKFQDVMGAARNVVIDNAEAGDTALRIAQLAEHGGSMPMAVRKFINYSTDPNKPQMTYEVARDFASNISRLSVDEYKRMTPVVAREVAKLAAKLNQANAKAAQAAGKGAEYKSAMREYARAKRIEDAISTTLSGAKKALPIMGAGGVGAWLTGKIVNAIRGIE